MFLSFPLPVFHYSRTVGILKMVTVFAWHPLRSVRASLVYFFLLSDKGFGLYIVKSGFKQPEIAGWIIDMTPYSILSMMDVWLALLFGTTR
ncbi:hypothetical protein SAMN05216325_105163 [Nitrosomonas marina]|uniref:Uncharacterized protein n=1 Tax=Nitrosomonas marina TaxID=917 RepID=A0A1H8CVM1_9PROT|nr:hypothetical protein SAMN05216325_105163 [Nitrosomonas marina]